jgi:hypothetical protein
MHLGGNGEIGPNRDASDVRARLGAGGQDIVHIFNALKIMKRYGCV